jgi:hypothetical protein
VIHSWQLESTGLEYRDGRRVKAVGESSVTSLETVPGHATLSAEATKDKKSQLLELVRILALIAALAIVVLGLLLGTAGVVLSLLGDDEETLILVTVSASLIVLTTTLGSAVAWHSWQAIRRHPSSIFRPRFLGLLSLLFFLVLAIGQVVLSLELLPVITFPPLHVVGTVLPPLLILALVGRALGSVTSWRDVTLQTASGAFLAAPLAFGLETVAVLVLLTVTFARLALSPGGRELLEISARYLQDPSWLQDPTALLPTFMSPAIVAVVFILVAVIIPIVEEGVKTIGVGVMSSFRRPTLAQAFLWGLACGAGFALVENLFNTTNALEAWAPLVLLRTGATMLHCLTGALMGLAWYQILVKQRWGYGLGLYATSLALHGLWNALSFGIALLSLQTLNPGSSADSQTLAGLTTIAAVVLLLLLAGTVTAGLVGLTWYVRKQDSAAALPPTDSAVPPARAIPVESSPGSADHSGD